MGRDVNMRWIASVIVVLLPLIMSGCGEPSGPVLIGSYSLDNLDGLLADREIVDIDTEVTTDGGGSFHFFSDGPMLVNLFELPTKSVKGNALVARCQMKSVTLSGWTTFELWIFPEEGPVRSVLKACKEIGQTRDWKEIEVTFPFLEDETSFKKLRLAVNISGQGHLWIDDLQIFSTRIQEED